MGEPGGSGAAAGAAAGGLAGCCAAAPYVKTPKKAPASSRLRGADEHILIMFSRFVEAFDPCLGKPLPAPVDFIGTVLNIFPSARNRKTSLRGPVAQDGTAGIEARWRCRASKRGVVRSVFGEGNVGDVEERLGKGKFEHDLTFVIRHFEDRPQEALRALGPQQFLDHGAGDFPRAIGIPQFFAFGVRDQFVADSRIEEKSRHGQNPLLLRTPEGHLRFSQVFYLEFAAAGRTDLGILMAPYEPIDPPLV
jgi:hypothetical protein